MYPAGTDSQDTHEWEFTRIDPNLIKIEAGDLWREIDQSELETLKASIAWRERRMKGSGILVPLLVTKMEGIAFYKLEDGVRRLKAIQALISEGMGIESVPVRILPSSLTISERLMLLVQSTKPLDPLEEGRILVRLEKQGLSLERLAGLMNRPLDSLRKRVMVSKLTGPVAQALRDRKLQPEDVETLIDPDETFEHLQKRLEVSLKKFLARTPKTKSFDSRLGLRLGQKKELSTDRGTAWMPKILDPTVQYTSIEGLYEWMGGASALSRGYSKEVVEIVKLMLKYCGGSMGLQEISEKLKKL